VDAIIFNKMVFIFGNKGYGDGLGYIVTKCQKCKADRIFYVHQVREKLTLYFVPTIQYKAKQYMTCLQCNERYEIADELKPQIAERLMTEEQLKKTLSEIAAQTRLPLPYCNSCSSPVGPGMKFCPNCGGKIT
jgi:hypothetical protein